MRSFCNTKQDKGYHIVLVFFKTERDENKTCNMNSTKCPCHQFLFFLLLVSTIRMGLKERGGARILSLFCNTKKDKGCHIRSSIDVSKTCNIT